MSEKIRLRLEVRAVLEYDADPKDYDNKSVDEIVKIDQQTAEEDVYMFLDNEDTKWDITVSKKVDPPAFFFTLRKARKDGQPNMRSKQITDVVRADSQKEAVKQILDKWNGYAVEDQW